MCNLTPREIIENTLRESQIVIPFALNYMRTDAEESELSSSHRDGFQCGTELLLFRFKIALPLSTAESVTDL